MPTPIGMSPATGVGSYKDPTLTKKGQVAVLIFNGVIPKIRIDSLMPLHNFDTLSIQALPHFNGSMLG